VSIEPVDPFTFNDAINRMYEVYGFLSMIAGRTQSIKHIQITTTEALDEVRQSLDIHLSYRWKGSGKNEQHKPHSGDVPLNPVRDPTEFGTVFADWIDRQSGWALARSQYFECLRKDNKYGSGRIVASSNMFDILPPEAVPLKTELPNDLAATRDACAAIFREHPDGIDRNSALSALGRLGKPSLPKKVAYRVDIVLGELGERFPDLRYVASVAVKCRNFFVHGSSDDIDYQRVVPLVPFLTDALEFIFAASDLIEAGWNARRWNSEPHGRGHSFARFCDQYDIMLNELRRVISA
jgi:ApeA N-terminal domain 1